MKKTSSTTMHCILLRFLLPLFLIVTFSFSYSSADEAFSGNNEVDSINGNEDLTRTMLKNNIGEDDEEKFKFLPHHKHKPFFKKPFFKIPPKVVSLKPIPKPIPVNEEKPLPIPGFKNPFPKPFPFVKKPIPKPIPFGKKPFPKPFIPKSIPVDDEKPLPIPGFRKPFPKPFIPKPIPFVKKPIPLVKKPFPKPIPKPIPFVKKPFSFPKKPFFPPVNP